MCIRDRFNPELNKLVSALEKYYDSNFSKPGKDLSDENTDENSPMSDDLEDFLDSMSSKFEE